LIDARPRSAHHSVSSSYFFDRIILINSLAAFVPSARPSKGNGKKKTFAILIIFFPTIFISFCAHHRKKKKENKCQITKQNDGRIKYFWCGDLRVCIVVVVVGSSWLVKFGNNSLHFLTLGWWFCLVWFVRLFGGDTNDTLSLRLFGLLFFWRGVLHFCGVDISTKKEERLSWKN
jgi:hypothetical protein